MNPCGRVIDECSRCQKPTEQRERYAWCPRCYTAFTCACDTCQTWAWLLDE